MKKNKGEERQDQGKERNVLRIRKGIKERKGNEKEGGLKGHIKYWESGMKEGEK